MNIYIGEPVEYSDMQGPCPAGFHVPLNSEWTAIKDAGISLGAWSSSLGDNCSTYLKIPYCGNRNYNTSISSGAVGSFGNYRSSSNDTASASYRFMIYSNGFIQNSSSISEGLSIRGMKTTPAIPDSSWTVLYQGAGSAGIYWNQTEGLISISSNGTTWYTLMDKNLGATTVWNSGDTLTDANCGNVFQRGNNYGFPGTLSSDSITTSSTTVNVAGYGPGNYYSSSTWITITPRRYGENSNLRGGVSQGSGTKSVEVQNIYIGEYVGEPITTSGIYWNESKGLISISTDGSTWYTIADKNLGATTAWNYGDAYSESNCGNFFQWGNNYGFSYSGSVTTSSTTVNAGTYGPSNYYSSSTRITTNSWDSSGNQNLWGNTTGTNEARRGPCDEGFHVPTSTEFLAFHQLGVTLGVRPSSGASNEYKYLKVPPGGMRFVDGSFSYQGNACLMWCSDFSSANNAKEISLVPNGFGNSYGNISEGCFIRPFKNDAVQPTSKWTKLN